MTADISTNAPDEGPLRIALHCRALATRFGGMERTVVGLGNHLASIGWDVCLFYNANRGAPIVYPTASEIGRRPIENGPNLPERFAAEAKKYAADVNVFFYADASAIPFVVALSSTGTPLVLHEGTNPERLVVTNWAERLGIPVERAAAEREALSAMATRVRVTLPSYIESFGPLMKPHVVSFPNAFPPAAPGTAVLRQDAPRKRFIHIGGLKANKNLMPALEAFASIAGQIPDWDLAIFSDEPPRANVRPDVEAFIRQSGFAHRILIYPPTQDIFTEYARSHVHVISSLSEGLPNCVAEAMRHALPSIGYDVCPGTNELVVHGVNGLLAEAADPVRSLAEQMLALALDDAARACMGNRGLEDSAIFDGDAVMAKWRMLLRDASAYRGDPQRLQRERQSFDPAALRKARRIQLSAYSAPPMPERTEGVTSLAVQTTAGAPPEWSEAVVRSAESRGTSVEILSPDAPGTTDRSRWMEEAAVDYLLCLSPGPHGDAELRDAIDFALRTAQEGADVGVALPPDGGVPTGLTTFARAGAALFARAPAVSVWRLPHLRDLGVAHDPRASLPSALLAAATASAILVGTSSMELARSWAGDGIPEEAEAIRLYEEAVVHFEDASVGSLRSQLAAVLVQHWVVPVMIEVFSNDKIDYDRADQVRRLAARLSDGATELVPVAPPSGIATMTAALGYYPWVRAALSEDPLPRPVLVTLEAALPPPIRRAIGGGLARRWPIAY